MMFMSNFSKIAETGKSFACALYKAQPGALIPNPVSDLLKLAWDSFCGDDDDPSNLPPPATPPFVGGQCPVFYEVRFQITDPRDPNRPSQTVQLRGDIAGAEARYTSPSPDAFNFRLGILARDNSGARIFAQQAGGNESTEAFQKAWKIAILSVRRLDNQPDNCGSLPPVYPPVPPAPPQGYTSPPTSITYNDGTDFITIFNLKPPVEKDDGPPDICITATIQGISFEVCFPFGKPPQIGDDIGDLEELLRNIQDNLNTLQDDVDNLNDKLDNLQDDFDDYTTPPPPPDDDPDLNKDPLPDDDGGEDDNTPGLKWVVVSLTTLPEKAQFGTPTVFFAGWVTFNIGGAYTVREQINFQRSVFMAPPGATGYGVTFTHKAKGDVVAYVEKPQP